MQRLNLSQPSRLNHHVLCICTTPENSRHFTAASQITRNAPLTVITVMVTEIQVPVPIQLPPAQLQMPVWHFSYRDRHHGPLLTATAPTAFGTGRENLYSDNLNMSAAHCRFQGAARAGAQAAAQTLQASPVPTLGVSTPLLQLPQGEALLSPEPLQADFTH